MSDARELRAECERTLLEMEKAYFNGGSYLLRDGARLMRDLLAQADAPAPLPADAPDTLEVGAHPGPMPVHGTAIARAAPARDALVASRDNRPTGRAG